MTCPPPHLNPSLCIRHSGPLAVLQTHRAHPAPGPLHQLCTLPGMLFSPDTLVVGSLFFSHCANDGSSASPPPASLFHTANLLLPLHPDSPFPALLLIFPWHIAWWHVTYLFIKFPVDLPDSHVSSLRTEGLFCVVM